MSFLSLEEHITPEFLKTFFFCGKDDAVVPPVNSLKLRKYFDEAGIKNRYNYYEHLKHGSGLRKVVFSEGCMKYVTDFYFDDADGR